MNSLSWTFNRLTTMGPAEVLWRARRMVSTRLEPWRKPRQCAVPSLPAQVGGKPWFDALPSGVASNVDMAPCVAAAERILRGTYDVFAMRGARLKFPPCWSRDPKTGTLAPRGLGMNINHRDGRMVGDIKYLWEINRHYELVTLAQAWTLTREKRFADGCRTMLDSWLLDQPWPLGIGWTSALENAIRLVNWAVAWQLLEAARAPVFDGEEGRAFRDSWLRSIYRHCGFIAGHFSLHSSANNHLFGEYMGLFIGATVWPFWTESAAWRETSRAGLEREARKQVGADGVNREQAVWYHHEVADMMLLCSLFGRTNGIEFSSAWWGRIESMMDFIRALMDAGGNVPMIGDSDDAMMVRFSPEPKFDVYRSLLVTGAVLFGRADFKAKGGRFDMKSLWLLGDAGRERFEALEAAPAADGRRVFPQSGYYILGKDFDTPCEVRIVADAGPIGYLSIAAHGHADALAFTLSAGGLPLLIDPGTYAYHTQAAWRRYFRGSSAHNVVTVDGADQSEAGGNFMWLRKAHPRCHSWHSDAERDCLVASHDGYRRLADPVDHMRTITFFKEGRRVVVEDVFSCRAAHEYCFYWHFDSECEIAVAHGTVTVRRGRWRLTMQMKGATQEPTLAIGQVHPPLGWISRRFDVREPAPTVAWREKADGPLRRVTVLQLETGESHDRNHDPANP
jgi:hypothetical protein